MRQHVLRMLPVVLLGAASVACGTQDLHPIRDDTSASGSGGSGSGAGASQSGGSGASSGSGTGGEAPAGAKRGIAYGYHSDADMQALSPGIGWWYNWAPVPDDTLTNGVPGVAFVPMVWGGEFDVDDLASKIDADAKYLLTFNEPNFGVQADLTPEQAAALWPDIEELAAAKNLAIVSPALNFCGGDCNEMDPFDWFDKFFAACPGCKVDYLAFHWYACTKDALAWAVGEYETRYDLPVWLTEFACLDDETITVEKELAYMQEAVAFLEADPKVFRYSWFTGRFDNQHAVDLLDAESGALTPLGEQYVSLPATP